MMSDIDQELEAKLVSETARISWLDLQRFFAQGVVLEVSSKLDLIKVAMALATDDKEIIDGFIQSRDLQAPSNDKARNWHNNAVQLWCVVVAPYVLVQDKD